MYDTNHYSSDIQYNVRKRALDVSVLVVESCN